MSPTSKESPPLEGDAASDDSVVLVLAPARGIDLRTLVAAIARRTILAPLAILALFPIALVLGAHLAFPDPETKSMILPALAFGAVEVLLVLGFSVLVSLFVRPRPRTLVFSAAGIELEQAGKRTHHPWSLVTRVVDSGDVLELHIDQGHRSGRLAARPNLPPLVLVDRAREPVTAERLARLCASHAPRV